MLGSLTDRIPAHITKNDTRVWHFNVSYDFDKHGECCGRCGQKMIASHLEIRKAARA